MLLTSGCSYTTGNPGKIPYKDWEDNIINRVKPWGDFLAEKLSLEHINVACNGADNEIIFFNLINELVRNNKITHVAVLWTSWDRWHIFNSMFTHGMIGENIETDERHRIKEINLYFQAPAVRNYLYERYINPGSKRKDLLNTTFNRIYLLEEYCNKNNITLLQWQGLDVLTLHQLIDENFHKEFIKYRKPLKTIGWPWYNNKHAEGFSYKRLARWKDPIDFRISLDDGHPTEFAHEFICSKFMEILEC